MLCLCSHTQIFFPNPQFFYHLLRRAHVHRDILEYVRAAADFVATCSLEVGQEGDILEVLRGFPAFGSEIDDEIQHMINDQDRDRRNQTLQTSPQQDLLRSVLGLLCVSVLSDRRVSFDAYRECRKEAWKNCNPKKDSDTGPFTDIGNARGAVPGRFEKVNHVKGLWFRSTRVTMFHILIPFFLFFFISFFFFFSFSDTSGTS